MKSRNEILVELGLVGIMSYFLFFVSTNVNPTLGSIYQGLALLGIILAVVDISYGKKSIPLVNKRIDWGKAILISAVSYVVLIAGSYIASGLAKAIPLSEILGLLGASAPIFSSSPSINFLIFAIVIPFLETYVIFGISIDLFSSLFKIDLQRKNIFSTKLMTLIIVIMISFLLFHVNAKGIENESALILVAIMAFISCVLVIVYQEFRIPILFHIIANTVGYLTAFTAIGPAIVSLSLPLLDAKYLASFSLFFINPKFLKNRKLYKLQFFSKYNKPNSNSNQISQSNTPL